MSEKSPPLQVEGRIAKNKFSGSGGHISFTDMRSRLIRRWIKDSKTVESF